VYLLVSVPHEGTNGFVLWSTIVARPFTFLLVTNRPLKTKL
jgi:hypothetical protein